MQGVARAREVGGSLVVTIPKEIVAETGIRKGEVVELEIRRVKRSYFGAAKGVGAFTEEDRLDSHG